jgi:hypothetical protein
MTYRRLLFPGFMLWLAAAGWQGQAKAQLPSHLPAVEGAAPSAAPVTTSMELDQLRQMGAVSDPSWWSWQVLPGGLMYRSYLAGTREPRLGSQLSYVTHHGWVWDAAAGGRVGLLRFGTPDDGWPEGWQLDVEGGAFPRLDLENERDLVSADFRVGLPITYRRGPWETKIGYYHLSSHLGDEYMIRYPSSVATRDNYVRETALAGLAFRPVPAVRLYGEAGYAFSRGGLARPWEFQFGAEYSPIEPVGARGAPFLAVNSHLRQENDFGGNVVAQLGWQWRGRTGQLFRVGAHYFNGKSDQYQFVNQSEEQIGLGLWYDF